MGTAEQVEQEIHESFTVLIVDDDAHFRNAYVRALNLIRSAALEASMQALSAASSAEALGILETHSVDCCVLDYKMPDINGLELQNQILALYPDMAILFVTGEGCEEVAAEAIKSGAMDYIVKGGISIDQLESSIVHSVNRVRLSKALEMQRKHLIEAERQRIMMQSLGTACHHISQPLTVLRSYIVMLKRKEEDPKQRAMLVEAFKACEALCDIVWKIGHTSRYKTEPYLQPDPQHPADGTGDLIELK
jgi:FixJ family two-component response regulator